jgi:hypothetical protein
MEELFPLEASWIVALVTGTLAVVMLLHLARSLPAQNIILIAVSLLVGEGLTDWLMVKYRLNVFDMDGPMWCFVGGAALLWLAIVLSCRKLAQFIVEPWKREKYIGLWILGISGVLTGLFQFGWPGFNPDPFDVGDAAIMAGIRAGTTVLLLACLSPWFIRKRPFSRKEKSKLAQQPENEAQ